MQMKRTNGTQIQCIPHNFCYSKRIDENANANANAYACHGSIILHTYTLFALTIHDWFTLCLFLFCFATASIKQTYSLILTSLSLVMANISICSSLLIWSCFFLFFQLFDSSQHLFLDYPNMLDILLFDWLLFLFCFFFFLFSLTLFSIFLAI